MTIQNKSICFLFSIVFVLLSSCNTTQKNLIHAIEDQDYSIRVNDNYFLLRFDLEISSYSSDDLCLSYDQWPNYDTYRLHRLHGEIREPLDAEIKAVSKTATYLPLRANVSSECTGKTEAAFEEKCYLRVGKGQTMRSVLSYKYFNQKIIDDKDKSKLLEYSIDVLFCKEALNP